MTKTLLILTAALGLTMSAHAHLGDTEMAMVQALGQPSSIDGNMETFFTPKYKIDAQFDENRICQNIHYVKLDGTTITRAEADQIDNWNIDRATMQKHCWVNNHWKPTKESHCVSWSTNAAGVHYELITGPCYFSDPGKWFDTRSIYTAAGIALFKQWIPANQADQKSEDKPDTSDPERLNVSNLNNMDGIAQQSTRQHPLV